MFGQEGRICVTQDCDIWVGNEFIVSIGKEHPNCKTLCDILRDAKKRLLSTVVHRRGIEFGYILNDLNYYKEEKLITEEERKLLTHAIYLIYDKIR